MQKYITLMTAARIGDLYFFETKTLEFFLNCVEYFQNGPHEDVLVSITVYRKSFVVHTHYSEYLNMCRSIFFSKLAAAQGYATAVL
jgi:hypothetical protein